MPRYTIFIPTYNRAHTIGRSIASAGRQSFRDFEILIVDDGSTDDTHAQIASMRCDLDVPLRYAFQPNQGKHVAYNHAATIARGQFLILLDSDDALVPDALDTFDCAWKTIPEEYRDGFAGVEGLCRDSAGTLHGTPFPDDIFDTDYITCRYRYGVTGEKRHAIRTEIVAAYPYPVVAGERHVRPSFAWKRIAHRYRFRYINRVVQTVDFRDDGLTRRSRVRRLQTPGGLYLYYRDDLLLHAGRLTAQQRRHSYTQYIRYGLRYGIRLREQWYEVPQRWLWVLALPRGLQDWILDGVKAIWLRKELR